MYFHPVQIPKQCFVTRQGPAMILDRRNKQRRYINTDTSGEDFGNWLYIETSIL